ncbi:MAG: hypothetical protein JXJ18_10660 [Rhodobacteraceae bacterium]|nr:hypothetical protein [Paracoccaceae bacterium]
MHRVVSVLRPALLLAGLAFLTACGAKTDLAGPPEPLGDFRLGYDIVVSKNAKMIPPSRSATPEEWEAVLKEALDKRFRRYDGEKLYHFGINVDGYALAVPGIPVVLSPKSILVLSANVWDDAAGKKLNEEPKQVSVLESLSGDTLVGSGLTQNKDEQMRNLAENAAVRIERWLVENREDWFAYDPATAPKPVPAASTPETPAQGDVDMAAEGN